MPTTHTDPQVLTAWLLRQDLGKLVEMAWENGRTLGELAKAMTVQQFIDLFWSPASKPTLSPTLSIASLNKRRALKGEPPVWPSWLMRSVPKL
jgi:hypothetical protein